MKVMMMMMMVAVGFGACKPVLRKVLGTSITDRVAVAVEVLP